jgi:hypothetical protein
MLAVTDELPAWVRPLFAAGVKLANDPKVAYSLAGTLYLAKSGFLLLSVPNALVRGFFSAMNEPGVELPPVGPDGQLNAHLTVMRPEEIKQIGGADKITERGKQFGYTIGRLYSVKPSGWPAMARVWVLRVHSAELQKLRRSYGLSSLPNNGKHDFYVGVAVRRKSVLGRNDVRKTT